MKRVLTIFLLLLLLPSTLMGLENMLPSPVSSYKANRNVTDSIFFTNCSQCSFGTPNFSNFRFGQSRVSVFFSSCHSLRMKTVGMIVAAWNAFRVEPTTTSISPWSPSLSGRILHVVGRCSKKQMERINTRWIIAVMTDKQTLRALPIVQKIRNAICPVCFTTKPQSSIAISVFESCLYPAISIRSLAGGLINVDPKALNVLLRKLGKYTILNRHGVESPFNFVLRRGAANNSLAVFSL